MDPETDPDDLTVKWSELGAEILHACALDAIMGREYNSTMTPWQIVVFMTIMRRWTRNECDSTQAFRELTILSDSIQEAIQARREGREGDKS